LDQSQIQLQFNQAIQLFQNGQHEMAEHMLRPIYIQLPDHLAIANTMATILISNKKLEEGLTILQRSLKKEPNNAEINGTLANAFEQKGELNKAEFYFGKAIKLQSNQVDFYFSRGAFYMRHEKLEKAINDYKKCIQIQAHFLPALVNVGLCNHQLGELKEAEKYYTKVLEQDEAFSSALINMGHCKADLGLIDDAIEYYKKAIKVAETDENSWQSLIKIYFDQDRLDEASHLIERSLKKIPNSATLHLLAGNVFQASGNLGKAERSFEKSLKLDPNSEGANRNLRRILHKKIPGWHFTMLADEKRNKAYQDALEKVVELNTTVLDIGTGSGILSMMAARAGAKQIYACEMHSELAKVAREIIKQNGFEGQIEVFNQKSTLLDIEKNNLDKADVLVSEILDAGVIGEGVLPSIRHALMNLCKEGVKIIPAKTKLYACLIEIPSRSKLAPIKEISGFDLSHFDRFRIPDEYTTINLINESYQSLSEEFFLHEYDFYNIPSAIQDNSPKRKKLEIKISQSGKLQAVVFWFDLFLDDEIMVSSRPGGELLHWGQALYCFPNTQDVASGTMVNLEMIHSDQLIRFDYALK